MHKIACRPDYRVGGWPHEDIPSAYDADKAAMEIFNGAAQVLKVESIN
jgi:hypothetical protein